MTGLADFDPSPYIGRQWHNGTQDCWALVRDVYRDQLNIELPQIVVDADNLRAVLETFERSEHLGDWRRIERPEHLCLVFFTPGHHRATHCGLWLDIQDGRFLHSHRKAGVVCEDRITLGMNGWCNPVYYRFNGREQNRRMPKKQTCHAKHSSAFCFG